MLKINIGKDWVVISLTALVLLGLCVVIVNISRSFFSTDGVIIPPQDPDGGQGLGLAGELFGQQPRAVAPQQSQADIKVYGILAGTKKAATYALFLIDGETRVVAGIGQEVANGFVLTEVSPKSVILRGRSGEMEIPITSDNTPLASGASNGTPNVLAPRPSTPPPPAPRVVPSMPNSSSNEAVNDPNAATNDPIDIFGNGTNSNPSPSPSPSSTPSVPYESGPQPVIDGGPEDRRG